MSKVLFLIFATTLLFTVCLFLAKLFKKKIREYHIIDKQEHIRALLEYEDVLPPAKVEALNRELLLLEAERKLHVDSSWWYAKFFSNKPGKPTWIPGKLNKLSKPTEF